MLSFHDRRGLGVVQCKQGGTSCTAGSLSCLHSRQWVLRHDCISAVWYRSAEVVRELRRGLSEPSSHRLRPSRRTQVSFCLLHDVNHPVVLITWLTSTCLFFQVQSERAVMLPGWPPWKNREGCQLRSVRIRRNDDRSSPLGQHTQTTPTVHTCGGSGLDRTPHVALQVVVVRCSAWWYVPLQSVRNYASTPSGF
jgi:hypothetical protein